ncbi:MAG: efflux RND transporter permease subunit [Pirellulales bacterium]
MNFIESIVRNPVKVAVGVLLVALFGTIALLDMPKQLTPEVQVPTITIRTRWQGASPPEVEQEIVHEQEEQLRAVEGMTKLSSECKYGQGELTLEFAVGTNMNEALVKVVSQLQQVREYPENADEPTISTSSSSDQAIAWFILGPRVPDADEIRKFAADHAENDELRAALDHAALADNPGVRLYRLKQAATRHPQAAAILPDDIDVTKLRKYARDEIVTELKRVPGVADSNIMGGQEEEMQVVVDPAQLAARQLTILDVRDALRRTNQNTSAGEFWESKFQLPVRSLGKFENPGQVLDTIVARRDSAAVYVRDVADVRMGYKKPDGLVRRFGEVRLAMNVSRTTGANVLEVMEGLKATVARINARQLRQRGLELVQVYDETEYINSAIDLVWSNIWIGSALTTAVLLLFLRSGRSTFVLFLAIPTSIIGTFLMLGLMGRSLNVVSLAGMAFAVGMLVDNAVVVLENIFRRWQNGEPAAVAAVRGTAEVWGAVVASTLTTLAVFIPVVFVQEESGQLFRDIALAISSAVGLSLIASMTVIPAAGAILLRGAKKRPTYAIVRANSNGAGGLHDGSGAYNERVEAHRPHAEGRLSAVLRPFDRFGRSFVAFVIGVNDWLQQGTLRRLSAVAAFVLVSVALSYLLAPKVEYLPTGNRNMTMGIIMPPPGYNIDELMKMGDAVEDRLRPYWDIDPSDPKYDELKYPAIEDFFYVARGRSIFMGLRAADPLRAGELVPLIQTLNADLEGTIVIGKQSSLFERGFSAGRTIDIEITGGRSIEQLVGIGRQVFGQVSQLIPGAQVRPKPSLDLSSPELQITEKREQAADLRVRPADMGYIVSALVDGAYAGDYFIGGNKIDLTIIGDGNYVKHTQDVANLPIAMPSGELVTLDAIANVKLSSGPEQIDHREHFPAITIEVSPPAEMPLETALALIRTKIVEPLEDGGQLGDNVQINLAGTADKLRAAWNAVSYNLLLALAITYLLMAALFESWLYPFVIIVTVPLGAIGGILALAFLNLFVLQTLDVLTMLGFIILIGTVVNNPILIVHQTLNHMREDGMNHREAVLESVRTRIRPIFMTTLTTLFGLLPLVLMPGAGSELYRGLGAVMLGGLLVSTVVTLILTPSLFTLTLEAKARFLERFGSKDRPIDDDEEIEPVGEPSVAASGDTLQRATR